MFSHGGAAPKDSGSLWSGVKKEFFKKLFVIIAIFFSILRALYAAKEPNLVEFEQEVIAKEVI